MEEFIKILKALEEFIENLRKKHNLTDYKFILKYKDQDQVILPGKRR